MSVFTVLGAGGFIGSSLAGYLRGRGHAVHAVGRDDRLPRCAGNVVFCIGLTADFRTRPFETVTAHVSLLQEMLQTLDFESFTYLSSTRVYQHLPPDTEAHEDLPLSVNSNDPSDLYNLSKLMGESLCFAHKMPTVRSIRLSNVYGADEGSENFLSSLLRDARTGRVQFRTAMNAAKDYVCLDDVLLALERIPERAKSRLINVASGRNVSNAEIVDLLQVHTGCEVEVMKQVGGTVFPPLSIARMRDELNIVPQSLGQRFPELVAAYKLGRNS